MAGRVPWERVMHRLADVYIAERFGPRSGVHEHWILHSRMARRNGNGGEHSPVNENMFPGRAFLLAGAAGPWAHLRGWCYKYNRC